jgi:conjugative transposon TraN protein
MRFYFVLAGLMLSAVFSFGQSLPVILLPGLATFHFISPEPIQYVDISTKRIAGDLPLKNVLRIKRLPDSAGGGGAAEGLEDAVVTVAGEKFIAQFRVSCVPLEPGRVYPAQLEILPEHMRPLDVAGASLSRSQLDRLASQMLFKKQLRNIARAKAFGIEGNVNHLSTMGDYIFLDVSFLNTTNLRYDTDEIRFKIEDERVNKASTVQSIELRPEFVLFGHPAFKRNYRNVFVFKKFSFPGHKVLKIGLSEKQISGRTLELKLKYQDVLEADVL